LESILSLPENEPAEWPESSEGQTSSGGYDGISAIYDIRAEANPAAAASWGYFTGLSVGCQGDVVELGVGTGKVAIAAAQRGKPSIGVDPSVEMLSLCRQNVVKTGVSKLVHLVGGDAETVGFNRPVDLVMFPFRGIGHIIKPSRRMVMFRNILKMLKPGGRFVFDHYIVSNRWMSEVAGRPQAICEFLDKDGRGLTVVDTYFFEKATQVIMCEVAVFHGNNKLKETLLAYSWTHPDQFRKIAREVGFDVEGLFFDYQGGSTDQLAEQQVWVLRKPLA
jgi:SAM-dependent methyltransferase